ncbi:MAG: gamma-glutamylcyclotransferase family protein [Candidatus Promineifilaceae bacterium]|jgi:gamma-glutamylcyclotransferase (GGCT)/AIG2-like uncharacterized protein YtfP
MSSEATSEPLPFFVYGTLLPGQPNAFLWQDTIRALEYAQISDCCLYDLRQFPVMVNQKGYTVHGLLVWVADEHFSHVLEDLDFFEGFHPGRPQKSNFRRVKVQAAARDGRTVIAWAYMGHKRHVQGHLIIESGDWAQHVAARNG